MSRAGPRAKRIKNDAYMTPDNVAQACVDRLLPNQRTRVARVLEPSVGGGAFARAARNRFPGCFVTGVDIDTEVTGYADCDTYTAIPFEKYVACHGEFDWIIGNPPYSQAQEHVEHALSMGPKEGVAFLLRLNFLGGQKRREFWDREWPTTVHILSRRPSFTGNNGTDTCEYAFMTWLTGNSDTTVLTWI